MTRNTQTSRNLIRSVRGREFHCVHGEVGVRSGSCSTPASVHETSGHALFLDETTIMHARGWTLEAATLAAWAMLSVSTVPAAGICPYRGSAQVMVMQNYA